MPLITILIGLFIPWLYSVRRNHGRQNKIRHVDELIQIAEWSFTKAKIVALLANHEIKLAQARALAGEINKAEERAIADAALARWQEVQIRAIEDFLAIPTLTEDDRVQVTGLLIDLRSDIADPSDCASLGLYR